jgi:hypothetical protein
VALCPAAAQAASRDVQGREAPDECPWASLRAVVQKVDSLVSFRFHPGHQAAACIVFPARRAASDAWAGRDVVPRQSAARFPVSFRERVRDSPSASAETAWQDVLRPPQVLPPLVERRKVEFPAEPLAALLAAAHWAQRQAVPSMTADESV